MMKKKPSRSTEEAQAEADRVLQDLAKVAFSNILDFARFEPNGRVHIFDWDKAREIGAKVSVSTRMVGRGKNAREVRTTTIRMPDKYPALIKLGERLGLFQSSRRRKRRIRPAGTAAG